MKKIFFAVAMMTVGCAKVPAPYGALPTRQQVEWQQMEYYMFAHFGPNTFTDMEWGLGNENPDVFAPTALDCRQWARIAKDAGMRGIILTAKHHDGFCLWPSEHSTHTVRESAWRDGGGDVVRELSDACRQAGIGFGVYVSPWDRNHPLYGTREYNEVFAATLREVLTGYGDVFEQWLDGANGEGPNGKKQVYDWPLILGTIAANQPNAVIFSDIGPGARWIGNERGFAGTTNWSTLNTTGFGRGSEAPIPDTLNVGNIRGAEWVPGECDVSIRPGWFYSPATDDKVKTASELMDIYYGSVGRNATLLLNVPPDRTGRINPADSARLMEFRALREAAFAENLAPGAKLTASNTRGRGFSVENLIDGDFDTYWATKDGVNNAEIVIDFSEPKQLNTIVLQEYIPLGQRVKNFTISCLDSEGAWREIATETTIGYKRIVRFPTVETLQIKIEIEALACPTLSAVEIY